MEENKNNLWESNEAKAENQQASETETNYPKEEIGDVGSPLDLDNQMEESLDSLVAATDQLAKEQNEANIETQAPVLDYGTGNIAQELHHAEEQARQEYTPLSGQNPAGAIPVQPQSGYDTASGQPLHSAQYGQPPTPNVPTQQPSGTTGGQTAYNPAAPDAGQQSFYGQPSRTAGNANQQYAQQGQAYQGAPEYQDYSVFYQNQTGPQQGGQQAEQQGQYSNQYNQQQYTQQSGQQQQKYQPQQQGYYQNNQYYPAPQKQGADGLAIASVVLGAFSIIGNFAMDLIGISFIAGIVGLILGIVSRNKSKNSMSLVGIILSAVGLVITVVLMIACVACLSSLMSYGYDGGINPWSYF